MAELIELERIEEERHREKMREMERKQQEQQMIEQTEQTTEVALEQTTEETLEQTTEETLEEIMKTPEQLPPPVSFTVVYSPARQPSPKQVHYTVHAYVNLST